MTSQPQPGARRPTCPRETERLAALDGGLDGFGESGAYEAWVLGIEVQSPPLSPDINLAEPSSAPEAL